MPHLMAISTDDNLGYKTLGTGTLRVIVMNDWLSDTSSWDAASAFLDQKSFTYIFADLRGYGRSRALKGPFGVEQAAQDILALADSLDIQNFAIVGHSMSCLVALHLAQNHADRILSATVVTPPPIAGMGVDDENLAGMAGMAALPEETLAQALNGMWGARLSPNWAQFKAKQWQATATVEAAAAYAKMFARDGMPNPTAPVSCPLHAITAEQDMEPMRAEPNRARLTPLSATLTMSSIIECGHYPMQEAPPLFVTHLESFLKQTQS